MYRHMLDDGSEAQGNLSANTGGSVAVVVKGIQVTGLSVAKSVSTATELTELTTHKFSESHLFTDCVFDVASTFGFDFWLRLWLRLWASSSM